MKNYINIFRKFYIMKIYNYLSVFLLAAGAFALASCSKEDNLGVENMGGTGLQISVTDAGYPVTRAIDQAYKTNFADGDAIGVFAVRGGKVVDGINNRKFTLTEGNWELDGEPIEYKGTEFKYMKFFAYYPYSEDVKFDASKYDSTTKEGDPFESLVNSWVIGENQSGGNYTQYDLMTSSSDAEGERLQGKVAFVMEHRMALTVFEMPKLTYDFTNPGVDDYQISVGPSDFNINGKKAQPHYDASTNTYMALVNPDKEFTVTGSYMGASEMEYSAKGNLAGGSAKKFTIKDGSKITHTLAIGDYFCSDGSLVSKDSETVPSNVIGVVVYAGNPQPHVMAPDACSETQDALYRDFPGCSHGMVLSLRNAVLEDGTATSQYRTGKSATYDAWFDADEDWAGKFVYCNSERDGNLKNDALTMFPAFFGYNNTMLMTMVTEEQKASPTTCDNAYGFIKAYRDAVEVPPTATPWYVPSIRCWQQVADNLTAVNKGLAKADGEELISTTNGSNTGHYWSSTMRNAQNQWTHAMEGGAYFKEAERGSRAGQFRMMLAF